MKAKHPKSDPTQHEASQMKKHREDMHRELSHQKRGRDHHTDRVMLRKREGRSSR